MKIDLEETEISPCPLCGGQAFLHTDRTAIGDSFFWVKCDGLQCGCTFNSTKDQSKALSLWNRRA